jgi:deoxyribonuclease-4
MSVAGGLPLAVDRAALHGCQSLQIFTKNANQWRGRPLLQEEAVRFRARVAAAGISPVVSHASYLINLAAGDSPLREQSLEAMADEIERAEALGLMGVVLHPGSAVERSNGISLIAGGLAELLDSYGSGRVMVLLEHTAGQGNSIGWRFEEIAAIVDAMHGHPQIGVCLDTCHLIAAGYDIATPDGYAATFDAFERVIGLERLNAFHLNDSKKPLGSRVDRHTHIGEGHVGTEAFRRIVNDARFAALPMLLETPKEDAHGPRVVAIDRDDENNLTALRRLLPQT